MTGHHGQVEAVVEASVELAVELVRGDQRAWSGFGSGVVSLSLLPSPGFLEILRV